jgi:thymidine kinase
MFAGKTTALIERLAVAERDGLTTVAFKHAADTRYDDVCLATHDGRRAPAIAVGEAASLERLARDTQVIGIDEAHFFETDLIDTVLRLRDQGRTVVVVGIDNDVWGRPLPPFPEFKQLADQIDILEVPCAVCGNPGRYSQRITPIEDGNFVGGTRDYEIRCHACFVPIDLPAPPYGQRL